MSERYDTHRHDGFRLNRMIFISLLFHVVILSLLFFSPSFPSPKLTFGPVYSVSLVSLPRNALEQRSTSAVAKELMTANRPEMVLKKQVAPSPVIPIRSLEPRKKQDPTLDKAMEEIRKKAAATGPSKPSPAKAATEKTEKAGKEEAATGFASQPGTVEMDTQMRAYYAMVWSQIKGKWVLPQGILRGEALETIIDVTILRSGAVTQVNFEKRSGNRYFDESAMKAIRKASPLPPLPAWIGGNSLGVGIRFHSSELRS
ncbi:MAG: TonB family protein [Deltaproteobacteria bacterium]|nr:TonB family protein [Deltaproteobacteria bacterium]